MVTPFGPPPVLFLRLCKVTTLLVLLIPTNGTPWTLLTFIKLPILNGIDAPWSVVVSLGLSTSKIVVPAKSTSYPLTYAVPEETLTQAKSSLGSLSCSVFCSSVNIPLFDILSFKHSSTSIVKSFTV